MGAWESNARSRQQRAWWSVSVLERMHAVERCGVNFLARIASASASAPMRSIGLHLALCALCFLGFMRIRVVSKGDDLWVDQHSKPMHDYQWVLKQYGAEPRYNQLLVVAKPNSAVKNVVNRASMLELLEVYEEIVEFRVLHDGKWYGYADVCLKTVGGRCTGAGPQQLWDSSSKKFKQVAATDDDVMRQAAAEVLPGGYPVVREAMFGNFQIEDGRLSAESCLLTLTLKGSVEDNSEDAAIAMKWEDGFVRMFVDEAWQARDDRKHIYILPRAMRSIDDELQRNVGGDIVLFAMSFVIMGCFSSVTLGQVGTWVDSRITLATAGTVMVVMAVGSGYALAMLCGVPFTTLQQILPFILIAIGVDDAFVITSALDATDASLPIEQRIGIAYTRCSMLIAPMSLICPFASASVCLCVHICIVYACMHACMHACSMCVFLQVFFCLCVCLLVCLSVHACTRAHVYTRVQVRHVDHTDVTDRPDGLPPWVDEHTARRAILLRVRGSFHFIDIRDPRHVLPRIAGTGRTASGSAALRRPLLSRGAGWCTKARGGRRSNAGAGGFGSARGKGPVAGA